MGPLKTRQFVSYERAATATAIALQGGYAVVFINAGSAAADIECDGTCMTAMGFKASDKLTIRDLWASAPSLWPASPVFGVVLHSKDPHDPDS